jgi:hypothetical protein
MLKLQPLITTGAGLLFALPAFVLDGGGDLSSLGAALRETDRALEVLRGVESAPPAAEAAELLRGLTEAPYADAPTRDGDLERLRNEVGLLQVELDALDARVLDPRSAPFALGPDPGRTSSAVLKSADAAPGGQGVSTGLSAAQRAALFGGAETAPAAGGPGAAAPPAGARAPGSPGAPGPEGDATAAADRDPAPEGDAYSADPLRHANALYRAGRYKEGFALISGASDPAAVCVQARFLEKLGRIDEAIDALASVVGELQPGYEATRAQSDLDFFRWKRDFLARLPEPSSPEERR